MTPAVEFQSITKSFGGLLANDRISFRVEPGEIHAVVGENGAGKSTLMGILSGFLRPDQGRIFVSGAPLEPGSPDRALAAGVGLCAQHFHQVPTLTGLENILLGGPRATAPWSRGAAERLRALMERYGLETRLDEPVEELSVGEQERIEILKLLHRDSRILILDEPTAVLAPSEVESLFAVLRTLAAEGRAVLFVSHKLPEVLALAARVTVLRRGRRVGTLGPGELEEGRLVEMIVGGRPPAEVRWRARAPGRPVLAVDGLSSGRGGSSLRDMRFTVREGEIVGIGGVEGNGQKDLVETLLGYRPRSAGRIKFLSRPIRPERDPAYRSSIGVIPEDRQREGLLPSRTLVANAVLGGHERRPFTRGIRLDWGAMRAHARRIVETYHVSPERLDLPARALSGGNQQRFIAGREISRSPELLIAVHPSRGVDLLATRFLHARLLEERDRGTAILLITADLAELRALSDRVLILYRGRVAYEAERGRIDLERLHRSLLGLEGSGAGGGTAPRGEDAAKRGGARGD